MDNDLGSLDEWCELRSTIPEDEDEVFVGAHRLALDEEDKLSMLNIFLTTKRLLSWTKHCNNIKHLISLLGCKSTILRNIFNF